MKKIISVILAVVLLISIIPMNFFEITASAISPNEVKTKMNSFISKYPAGKANPQSNCYYFVKMMTDSIFGHGLPSQNSNDSNNLNQYKFNHSSAGFKNFSCIGTLVVKDGTLTTNGIKNLLSKAQPGDVIQMGYTKWNKSESSRKRSRHVMMVYSASQTGIILYHAGSTVYYGVGSGSDKLNGNTGKEIKWSELKYYFCNNADGLSLYRSKKVEATNSHTSHTYYEYYETAHPHKIYKKCSCGDWFYTGGTKKVSSCNSCYPKPSASVISTNDITVYNGQSVTLKWTASSNTSYYNLKYILNDAYYNVETGLTSREYTYDFTSAGTYYFYVDSVNANGYTQSNIIKITVLMYKWDYDLIFTDDSGRVSKPQVGKKTNITWRFYDGLSGKRYSQIAKYSYEIGITLGQGNEYFRSYTLQSKDEITFSYVFDETGLYYLYFGVNSNDPNLVISTLVAGFSSFWVEKSEISLMPKNPIINKISSTSVTLEKVSGYEYSKDGINWQKSNVFNNLNPNMEYSFYQRYAETENTKPSVISDELIVRTKYICADPGNNHTYSNNCDTNCNMCGAARKITHSYKNNVTKATTSKNGKIVKKCSTCGSEKKTTTIYAAKTVKLSATSYTYNGKTIKPSVIIKDSKGKTISTSNYTVKYASGRKNVGKYKVTVTFKGNYSGTKTLYFTINPVKTSITKLTATKKALTVSISKKSTQVTGYEIQYATNKKFTKAKTATVKSYKTTKVTLKKLTAKKTYYVRVRTYKTVNGKKYYSGWSTVKYKKTK